MHEINMVFTIEELVKLISCCDQSIIDGEERIRTTGNITFTSHNFTIKDSLNKVWTIKNKFKSSIIDHAGNGSKSENIHIKMDISDIIKIKVCCNSVITANQKIIDILGTESKISASLIRENQFIDEIKDKIKRILNNYYLVIPG